MSKSVHPSEYEFVEWDETRVQRFWDFVAQNQPDTYFAKGAGGLLVRHFSSQIRKSENILDFGCGAGFFLDHLSETKKKFAGCDLSEASIQAVRQKFMHHPNFLGGLSSKDFGVYREYFDLAFMLEVVEHLEDEPLSTALADARSLIKPGGRLIITTPNEEKLSDNWICCPDTGRVFHRWQHVRSWSAQSLSQTVTDAGFEVEKAYSCNILTLGLTPRALAYRFGYRLFGLVHKNLFLVARRP